MHECGLIYSISTENFFFISKKTLQIRKMRRKKLKSLKTKRKKKRSIFEILQGGVKLWAGLCIDSQLGLLLKPNFNTHIVIFVIFNATPYPYSTFTTTTNAAGTMSDAKPLKFQRYLRASSTSGHNHTERRRRHNVAQSVPWVRELH